MSAMSTSNLPALACRRNQAPSREPNAVPVTSQNADGATRVTVTSASMPPRLFSIWV